jgi:3-phosphoshikimate 1-carboxyvinyltransferase
MAAALRDAGASVEELDDGWRISAGRPRSAQVVTAGDHRVAMAMAVAGWTGIAAEVALDDPACVDVSYPSFWRDAASLGANP